MFLNYLRAMESNDEAGEPTGEITSVTPAANTRTRRSRNYRTRKGSIAPKDVIPKNLNMIGWTDEEDNEIFTRRTLSLTLDQLRAVCSQLGYLPLNIVSIGAASKDPSSSGAPQVAILYPLAMNKLMRQGRQHKLKKRDKQGEEEVKEGKDGEESANAEAAAFKEECQKWDPFPTTCWLTCPQLHARICKLEDKGWTSKFESKLQNNKEFVSQMERAHQAYINYRWALLSARDRRLVESVGWDKMLRSVGIAGLRVFRAVKCLHCHYAHFLARPADGNIVGQWVSELLADDVDRTELDLPHLEPSSSSLPLPSYRGSPRSASGRQVNESYRDELHRDGDSGSDSSEVLEGPDLPSSPPDKSIAGGPFNSPLGKDPIPSPLSSAKPAPRHSEEGQEIALVEEGKEESNWSFYCAVDFLVGIFSWFPDTEGSGGGKGEGHEEDDEGDGASALIPTA